MEGYDSSVLLDAVRQFSDKKVMVLGDLLLDRYVYGKVSRISPEAPIPVLLVDREDDYRPGGGCNVSNNLAKLGAEVYLVGVIGMDSEDGEFKRTEKLKKLLREENINIDGVFEDPERQTIMKTRVMAHHHPHHQQIVRVDREDVHEISDAFRDKIKGYIEKNIGRMDALIIEDYGKGLITKSLLGDIIDIARKNKVMVSVDPKENHFDLYRNVSVITPNRDEAGKAAGLVLDDIGKIKQGGSKLLDLTAAEVVLITLGEEGMMLFRKGADPRHIPTVAQDVYDVSGAGDTVIGVYTLSCVSGADPVDAARLANCAAKIVVSKTGAYAVSKEELVEELKSKKE
ncbi:MAG: D-glycero-beta-D-manno-heptose-7-phosphate kinase [Candidatus Omnitrophica bacterium]|nr:D-glycero-beta-D-manno-heptose-7-phosphate kinase [Candidatus Omnitrophota bacterium]